MMQTDRWSNINNSNDRFRLTCNNNKCQLSICNLLNGRIHITTTHNGERHSLTMSNNDMIFVISQFLKSLSKSDKEKLLDFYSQHS